MKKIKHIGNLIIKNQTNAGEPCKTKYHLLGATKEDAGIMIDRLILTSDERYLKYALPLKTFKGKTLYQQTIAIRLNTLNLVTNWLNTLDAKKIFK